MKYRTIKKAASWEMVSNIACLIAVWLIFGHFSSCLLLTLLLMILKIVMYYYHEQFWEKIK